MVRNYRGDDWEYEGDNGVGGNRDPWNSVRKPRLQAAMTAVGG